MIRSTLLMGTVLFLAAYAWRDWYKSLCGLILLMAVIEHPDAPKTMFGVQGLNPWNLLLVVVLIAWMVQRKGEGLAWDLPPSVGLLLLLYLAVVLVGFGRMMTDRAGIDQYPVGYLVSERLINAVKWVIPGLLLFDGSRSRARALTALTALLGVYVLLALQVIRWMPPGEAFSGDSLNLRSLKILSNEVGYHRVNLSMMLAGASWAILATASLARRRVQVGLIIATSLIVLYAQALTGGRMGYVTWAVVGLGLCLIRWRRYLPLLPVAILIAAIIAPASIERFTQGFSASTRDSNVRLPADESHTYSSSDDGPDLYTITAGRNVTWPLVIDKIGESPFFGYGRLAMQRTGISSFLLEEFGEDFPHPHNAYLEMLLDNGWVGLGLVLPFYVLVLARGARLLRQPEPLNAAIGGVCCALVLALLVASVGSQTFYPREGSVAMWAAIGLMLRASVDQSLALGATVGPRWALARGPAGTHGTRTSQRPDTAARSWWQRA